MAPDKADFPREMAAFLAASRKPALLKASIPVAVPAALLMAPDKADFPREMAAFLAASRNPCLLASMLVAVPAALLMAPDKADFPRETAAFLTLSRKPALLLDKAAPRAPLANLIPIPIRLFLLLLASMLVAVPAAL